MLRLAHCSCQISRYCCQTGWVLISEANFVSFSIEPIADNVSAMRHRQNHQHEACLPAVFRLYAERFFVYQSVTKETWRKNASLKRAGRWSVNMQRMLCSCSWLWTAFTRRPNKVLASGRAANPYAMSRVAHRERTGTFFYGESQDNCVLRHRLFYSSEKDSPIGLEPLWYLWLHSNCKSVWSSQQRCADAGHRS